MNFCLVVIYLQEACVTEAFCIEYNIIVIVFVGDEYRVMHKKWSLTCFM